MKKLKPCFKERITAVCEDGFYDNNVLSAGDLPVGTRCRITDARRPSALRAVEKVLQVRYNGIPEGLKKAQGDRLCSHTEAAGMTAKIVNGKVTCLWRDK